MEKATKLLEKKVLVAIDESENSYHALMWVLDNLKESVTKSTLVIFAAQPLANYTNVFAAPLGFARMYFPVSATPALIESIQDQNKRVSLGLLEKAKSICASRGVKVDTFTEAGDPKETIVAETVTEVGDPKEVIREAVEKLNIQLLVLGSHGRGAIKRAFLGSVSNYCVHHVKCPVLVVRKSV
ncbi:universal stress protein a-like protein [Fagus crenata]